MVKKITASGATRYPRVALQRSTSRAGWRSGISQFTLPRVLRERNCIQVRLLKEVTRQSQRHHHPSKMTHCSHQQSGARLHWEPGCAFIHLVAFGFNYANHSVKRDVGLQLPAAPALRWRVPGKRAPFHHSSQQKREAVRAENSQRASLQRASLQPWEGPWERSQRRDTQEWLGQQCRGLQTLT